MGTWKINGEIMEFKNVPQNAPQSVLYPEIFKRRPDLELKFKASQLNKGLQQNANAQQGQPSGNPTQEQLSNIQHAQPRSEQEVSQYKQQSYGQNPPTSIQESRLPGRPQGKRDLNYGQEMGYQSYGKFGTEEQRKQMARDALNIGGTYASFVTPGLAQGVKGAGVGLKIAGEMGTQGIIGALSNPEHFLKHGLTSAGVTGIMEGVSKGLKGTSKAARFAKDQMAPASAALAAYSAAKASGASNMVAYGAAVAAYKGGQHFINPRLNKNYNARKFAEELGPIDSKAVENFHKAKEYGIHHTPGQAGGVTAKAAESKVGTSSKGAELKHTHEIGQREAEKNAVEKLNKKIYNSEKHAPIKEQAYKKTHESQIPEATSKEIYKTPTKKVFTEKAIMESVEQNLPKKVAKDEFVQEAIDNVFKSSTNRKELSHIPAEELFNNGKFVDLTKREMDELISQELKHATGGKAKSMTDSKDAYLKIVDEKLNHFKTARNLHEREKAVQTINALTKKGQPAGKSLATYLNDADKKANLINHLKNVPGAEKHLNELHSIFQRTHPVTEKELAKAIGESGVKHEGKSASDLAREFMKMFKSGAYDEAAVKLITDPNWPAKLERLKRISSSSKYMAEFMRLLSKPTVAVANQGINKLDNRK